MPSSVVKAKPAFGVQFPDSSFAVVLDKGGLDALMGEDADEGSEAGQKFLQEVQRLLAEGGTYICISLLQAHVLSKSHPCTHSSRLSTSQLQ